MFVFTADDSSPGRVATHLRELLGHPTAGSEEDMVWHDGNERLRIALRVSHPGSLSEQMEWVTLPEAESVGLTAEARKKRARHDYWKAVQHRMEGEIEAAREGRRTVACAILEMPAGLDAAPSRDPYTLAKKGITPRLSGQADCSPGAPARKAPYEGPLSHSKRSRYRPRTVPRR
jgi:hypothetical protein